MVNREEDELLGDAITITYEIGKASAQILQRRLRIGYGRAVFLIEQMQSKGLIKTDADTANG